MAPNPTPIPLTSRQDKVATEALAMILAEVHCRHLQPHYSYGKSMDSGLFFSLQSARTKRKNWVDKTFFRRMAGDVLERLESGPATRGERILLLARCLACVNVRSFAPHYQLIVGDPHYELPYSMDLYDELPERTQKTGDVDRRFFRRMARDVMKRLDVARSQTKPSIFVKFAPSRRRENERNAKFAAILGEIHAHSFQPHYAKATPSFSAVGKDQAKEQRPDRDFFRDMARSLLNFLGQLGEVPHAAMVLALAIQLAAVHAHSFAPYKFSGDDAYCSLPERARRKGAVDRRFFRRMARDVLERLEVASTFRNLPRRVPDPQ